MNQILSLLFRVAHADEFFNFGSFSMEVGG